MKRKITAILAADVVGYSRLVAEDEEETLRRLQSYREVFEDFIGRAGGRVFNKAGDSILAEFPSAVEATRCAIDIQETMRTRNLAYPQDRRMDFRIGLTIGDVVERDGDLLGDAVNVAARLEGLAEAGGICVSQAIYDAVANKIGVQFQDLGNQEVKNIPRPVHAFRLGPNLAPKATGSTAPARQTVLSPAAPKSPALGLAAAGVAAALLGAGGVWFLTRKGAPEPERIVQQTVAPPATDSARPAEPPGTPGRAGEQTSNSPAGTKQAEIKPAEQTAQPPAQTTATAPLVLPSDPAEAFKALVERGGIVNEPKTAAEFYHNARSYEIRGDANGARRAYAAFAGLKLNVIDPLLRFAALLRVQEGRAGAREALTEIVRDSPAPAARAVHALQFDGSDRRSRLEQFMAEHPEFAPARYLLAEEYSEDRLGSQQTLGDRRKELENLTLFLNADREGRLQSFFMDHSVLAEWLDKARKRHASLEHFMKTATTAPVVTFTRHNTGWNANLQIAEATSEIAYRLKTEDNFRSTPTIPNIDPRTGKPMPMPYFEMPPDLETATIQIRYRDAAGEWVGPFDVPFEWRKALVQGQRQILDQFKNGWVAFRNEAPYENLVYFTHLASYSCAIAKAEIGFNEGPVSTKLPLPPCNKKDPFAIPSQMMPYFKMPPGVNAVTVKLTYADGTEAEPVTIRR